MRFFFALLIAFIVQIHHRANAEEGRYEQAIRRGLAYQAKAGEDWKSKRGCVSCHQIPPMLWSFRLGEERGFLGHETDLQQWSDWSTNVVNFVKPEQKADCDQQKTMSGNIDTLAGLLLALPNPQDSSWRNRFANKLATEQSPDGSWKPCGQLPAQNRDPRETRLATTLWVTLALIQNAESFDEDAVLEYISVPSVTETIEIPSLQLLLSDHFSTFEKKEILKRLEDEQNEDGGWGWRRDAASDALGTGLVLYALSAKDPGNSMTKRAGEFLISTQEESGRWPVPGTKRTAKGKVTNTASDWGSAWGLIGLLSWTGYPG